VSTEAGPVAIIRSGKGAQLKESRVRVADFVEVMGWKAVGNKLTDFSKTTEIEWLDTEGNKQTALF
jgi:topoisomerase-4 subunit A